MSSGQHAAVARDHAGADRTTEPARRAVGLAQSAYGLPGAIIGLQRRAGNRATSVLIQRCGSHPCPASGCDSNSQDAFRSSLRVSSPGESAELEADRVAAAVTTGAARASAGDTPGLRVARSEAPNGGESVVGAGDEVYPVLSSPSRPLDSSSRSYFEPFFGRDLSAVRVHDDHHAGESARSLGALAYTVGQHIVFAPGRYQPSSWSGRALLGHELTHTIQQSGSSVDPAPFAPPAIARQAAGGSGSPPAPSPPNTPAPADVTKPSSDADDQAVSRVVVSCADGLLAVETPDATFFYAISKKGCQVRLGSYTADVAVVSNDVGFSIHGGGKPGRLFTGGYVVRPGQPNPATLFRKQRSVTLDAVAKLEMPDNSLQDVCLLTMRPRVLIPAESFTRDLFQPVKFERELWGHKIPLAQFGWVRTALTATASASGQFYGGYGPGVLSDICLLRRIGTHKLGGRAHFNLGGHLGAQVHLAGGLALYAKYLSVFPVGEIGAHIDAIGTASGNAEIDSDLEVVYDTEATKRAWSVSSRNTVSVSGSLGVSARAHVAVTFLTRELWGQTWELVNRQVCANWRGTLLIKPDFTVEFLPGELTVGCGAAGSVAAAGGTGGGAGGGPGSPGGAGGIDVSVLGDLIRAIYDEGSAKTEEHPTIEVRTLPCFRYSLGPPGMSCPGELPEKAKELRVRTTDLGLNSFRSNIAVLKAEVDGRLTYFVSPNDPGELHSESLIFRQVEAIDPHYQRTRLIALYTERDPCGNCRANLIGIRRERKQDFGVFYSLTRSGNVTRDAQALMDAYIMKPK